MTREEKIDWLCRLRANLNNGVIVTPWNKEFTKALNEVLEQEPTTKNDLALIHTEGLDEEIRCTMCTNHMKSDRGCDGSCVVNNDMYKAVMDAIEKRIQPTTKNDLEVDWDELKRKILMEVDGGTDDAWLAYGEVCDRISNSIDDFKANLSSVTPQEPKSEWEHDHEILKAYSDGVNEVLDKIKSEIIEMRSKQNVGVLECLDIIDKYKAESEPQESEDKE